MTFQHKSYQPKSSKKLIVKLFKNFYGLCWILLLSFILFIIVCNRRINNFAQPYTYHSINKIPYNDFGLLLGTSQFTRNGEINSYSKFRIEAAVDLFRVKKIKYIIVSGAKEKYYNEPLYIKNELIEAGIPPNVIITDNYGFRTLESILRCQKIYGQNKFTVISQEFHNTRAVYIARNFGIEAIAYDAIDTKFNSDIKTYMRELLARVKALLEVHFLDTTNVISRQKN